MAKRTERTNKEGKSYDRTSKSTAAKKKNRSGGKFTGEIPIELPKNTSEKIENSENFEIRSEISENRQKNSENFRPILALADQNLMADQNFAENTTPRSHQLPGQNQKFLGQIHPELSNLVECSICQHWYHIQGQKYHAIKCGR